MVDMTVLAAVAARNDDFSVDGGLVLTILVIIAIVLLILFIARRF